MTMRHAFLCVALVLPLALAGCGPSFWTEVQYHDGRHQLLRPLPDFLVGRSRTWVVEMLGEPDRVVTRGRDSYVYLARDYDMLDLQVNEQTTRNDDLLTSHLEDTRFVSGMTVVFEKDVVSEVVDVVYSEGPGVDAQSLTEVFEGRDKAWILGQLGPPDAILPRMAGDTFVYRNRSLELWVLRVRPTITNNPAIYTRSEGNRYVRRLNVYFDRDGIVRNVSFPLGG
jgi:hypothetical protein